MAETTSLTQGDFQERVAERIRGAIGDLMPDDVLRGLVERAVEESLFKQRPVMGKDRWGAETVQRYEHPFLPGYVAGLVQERVDAAIREHMDARREEIDAVVHEVLGRGVAQALVKGVEHLFQGPLMAFQTSVYQSLNQIQQHGR